MATGLGFPAISAPNALDLRAVQTAIINARQRIEQLERMLLALTGAATSGSASTTTSAQLNTLRNQLAALTVRVAAIENWFTGDSPGIVVWNGGSVITRLLVAGDNITIDNPSGVAGNITISSEGGGGDSVLYDNFGQAMLTSAGQAITV